MYIAKTIKAGFQNRSDTYSGKLAYVIALGKDGIWRKEKSWLGWINEKIQPVEFENEPTEGFVLNKKVGDYKCDWNHRQAYSRVYDPRGFEFEITIDNLLFILECSSSIPGKALSGKFVYAWNGKDLVLLPENSQQYKDNIEFSRKAEKPIHIKDLKEGYTYTNKSNEKYIYLGRYTCRFGAQKYVNVLHKSFVKNVMVFYLPKNNEFYTCKKNPNFVDVSDSPEEIELFRKNFMESEFMDEIKSIKVYETNVNRDYGYRYIINKHSDEKIEINKYNQCNKRYYNSYNSIISLENNKLKFDSNNIEYYDCNHSWYDYNRKINPNLKFLDIPEAEIKKLPNQYKLIAVLNSGKRVNV